VQHKACFGSQTLLLNSMVCQYYVVGPGPIWLHHLVTPSGYSPSPCCMHLLAVAEMLGFCHVCCNAGVRVYQWWSRASRERKGWATPS
jgi:hypothetical protein